MKKYYVKFKKYNSQTIESIENKSLYFSTVYQFNDFNELGYIGGFNSDVPKDYIKTQLLDRTQDNPEFKCTLLHNAYKSGKYDREFLRDFGKRWCEFDENNQDRLDKYDFPLLEELLAYSSVGVFAVSDIKVFCDDSAQLMFAHYADNLQGLALIYEITNNSTLRNVEYEDMEQGLFCLCCRIKLHEADLNEYLICHECRDSLLQRNSEILGRTCKARCKPASAGISDRIKKWLSGEFDEIGDFLKKSQKWSYERESRFFAKPGLHKMEEVGLELRAILYSSRFVDTNNSRLECINQSIYAGRLVLQEITASLCKYEFSIEEKPSIDWLQEKLQFDCRGR